MKLESKLGKGLFLGFSSLWAVIFAGYSAATANSATINKALNAQTSKQIEAEVDKDFDSEYFKANYKDPDRYAKDSAELCRKVEREGLVLLTNKNNALPLPSASKVSFFAQGSVRPNYGSTGSSATDTTGYGSLKDAFESKNFSVNPSLWKWYADKTDSVRTNSVNGLQKTYTTNEAEWSDVVSANQSEFSSYGDAAIVTLTRDSGEGFDVTTRGSDGLDGSYLSITRQEQELLRGLTQLKKEDVFKRVIVLLNSAVPIQLDFLSTPDIDVDACLWIGNMGMSGAYGVADVFAGANPCGRLTDTYCNDNFSSPAMASWKLNDDGIFAQSYSNASAYNLNNTQKYYGVYVEGIYVGYRYYETRYEDYVTGRDKSGEYDYSQVAFPFGYGLSYTTFEYSNFKVEKAEQTDKYVVSVDVTNTGEEAGREIVQVYLQKPYIEGGIEKAAVELVGYAKTGELDGNGGSERVKIEVDEETFKSYDAESAGTYVMDKGDYYLTVGKDAHDAVNNILAKKGYTRENTENRMTENGREELASVALHLNDTDTTKYAKSTETGKEITNRFDFADMNRYAHRGTNSVKYVSRENWSGTWPRSKTEFSVANEEMFADLGSHKKLPVDESAESPKYNISSGLKLISVKGLPYEHEMWDVLLNQMTYEEQAWLISNAAFGTVTLPSVNAQPTKASDGPTAVSGSITGTSFPSEGIWASTFDDELIEQVGDFIAEDARLNGLDTMYAPGINIHRTPFGGRAHEYFSEDPYLSGKAAIAEVKGLQKKGVVAVLKHFAFNDEEAARNGISIWLNEQAAREIYLLPFEYVMRPSLGGEAAGAMSGFNRVGSIWTGASSVLQQIIAREEWDFQGYFITDMASSNGALFMTYDDGIFNGTDLFLGNGSKTALKDWKGNIAFRNRVREAAHRVLYVTVNYNCSINGITPNTIIVSIMPWWQITLLTALGVVSLLTAAGFVIYIYTRVKE